MNILMKAPFYSRLTRPPLIALFGGLVLFLAILWAKPVAANEQHHHDAADDSDEHGQTEQPSTGPHGGRLFTEGEISLEVSIAENTEPAELHAWILRNGNVVQQAQLSLQTTGLNGAKTAYHFRKQDDYWRAERGVDEPHSFDISADLRIDDKHYHWQWSNYEGRVSIPAAIADKVGIKTTAVAPAIIERHIQVYGNLVTPPDQQSHIRARFPGIIRRMNASTGDRVAKGDVLAVVESNQSLQTYQLRSPMEAIVQNRHGNAGEITGDAPLFTLLNSQQLWAELKIFPSQRFEVQVGQGVHVTHNGHLHESTIESITPAAMGRPFVLARVILSNDDGDMAPGDMVKAQIDAEKVPVNIAVNNKGLQSFGGGPVVFIHADNSYQAQPLKLGRSDGKYTEVLSGIKPGDLYVVENSYLIKADILKSGASHQH